MDVDYRELLTVLEEITVSWPLYRKHEFRASLRTLEHASGTHVMLFPDTLSMVCKSCSHQQPWDLQGEGSQYFGKSACLPVWYNCRACHFEQGYWFFVEATPSGASIMKVGQYPPLTLEPPPVVLGGMEKADLALYRKALTCRNSNFGIAAVAYLRRIVENRTNFLIDLIAARLATEESNSPLLLRVEEIKRNRRFSDKIDFAADLLPQSVRIGGQNPISLLHDLTSEALHGLSDENSVDVFDRCQLAFEHVIKRLKAEQDEDQQFREAMKKLTEKVAKKS